MNHRTLPSKQAWCFTWLFLRFSPEGWVDWLCAIFCCTSTRFRTRRPQPFFIKKLLQHRHMLYMFHLPWHRKWLHQVKNSEASFFWKKNPWWSIFQAIFWCYFLLLRCFFDVFPPKQKRLTLCFIVVRPQEATDGILGFKDGWYSPCGSAWWLVVATNPSEKPVRGWTKASTRLFRVLHLPTFTPHLSHQTPFTSSTFYTTPGRQTKVDSSLWPQRTVPKLPSGTNGCQTLKTATLNTFYFCQKRPLCQPPPSPTPPPYSHFVRKVKLRLAYRLAFVICECQIGELSPNFSGWKLKIFDSTK